MPDTMFNSLKLMFNQLISISTAGGFSTLISLLSIISLIATIVIVYKLIRQKQTQINESSYLLVYFIFVLFFLAFTFTAPIMNGTYLGVDCIRYIIPGIYLLMFNIAILFEYFLRNKKTQIKSITAITLLIVILLAYIPFHFSKNNPFQTFSKVKNYYPPFVQSIDELSRTYHIKNGLANYWNARFPTIFSKENVTINIYVNSINPVEYANNPYHYYYAQYNSNKRLIYNFIFIQNPGDSTTVFNLFDKKIIKRVTVGGFEFYIVPDFIVDKDFKTFELVSK
jgi:hypothetical protein